MNTLLLKDEIYVSQSFEKITDKGPFGKCCCKVSVQECPHLQDPKILSTLGHYEPGLIIQLLTLLILKLSLLLIPRKTTC